MSKSNIIDVVVVLKHETEKAWLVDHGGKAPSWIAKSKAELELNPDGKTHTLTIEQWLAEEKEII